MPEHHAFPVHGKGGSEPTRLARRSSDPGNMDVVLGRHSRGTHGRRLRGRRPVAGNLVAIYLGARREGLRSS